jgi:hypothetical protein
MTVKNFLFAVASFYVHLERIIYIISVLTMAGRLGGVRHVIIKKQDSINNKMIEFLAVTFVLPLLVTLGIMHTLGRETISTSLA